MKNVARSEKDLIDQLDAVLSEFEILKSNLPQQNAWYHLPLEDVLHFVTRVVLRYLRARRRHCVRGN